MMMMEEMSDVTVAAVVVCGDGDGVLLRRRPCWCGCRHVLGLLDSLLV